MEEQQKTVKAHKLVVNNRKTSMVTGVLDVLSFDLNEILLETEQGMLLVKGTDLHVNRLSVEKGEVDLSGTIDSVSYSNISQAKKQEIEIKTDKGKNIVWIHDNCVEMKEADCPDKYCVKQGKITKTRQNIVCLPHKMVVEIAVSDNTKGNEADVIAK